MTKLEKTLRRALLIDEREYTLAIDPVGLRLTEKGKRKGVTLGWQDLVNGDAAIATALRSSTQSHD